MENSFEELRSRVSKLNTLTGDPWPPEWQLIWVMEEIGEVSKELLKLSKVTGRFNPKKARYDKSTITEEIGDVLYGIISLADNLGIDLVKALALSVSKFEDRRRNQIR